jgi:hypothetical protein
MMHCARVLRWAIMRGGPVLRWWTIMRGGPVMYGTVPEYCGGQ